MKRYEFRWIAVGGKKAFHLFVDGEKTLLSCDSFVSQKVVHPDGTEHSLIVMSRKKEGAVEYAWFVVGTDAADIEWYQCLLKPPYQVGESGVQCHRGLSCYIAPWPTEESELVES